MVSRLIQIEFDSFEKSDVCESYWVVTLIYRENNSYNEINHIDTALNSKNSTGMCGKKKTKKKVITQLIV